MVKQRTIEAFDNGMAVVVRLLAIGVIVLMGVSMITAQIAVGGK